ncbi:hypothetical protein BKA62DRAFT_705758 [Auriculariales sp. MPI-PUGE-AT-0066]|nr:hypothetical protein BKA62DRAFT_705758 [Auriculariales sp. MPI-PUGE-AT-0066]
MAALAVDRTRYRLEQQCPVPWPSELQPTTPAAAYEEPIALAHRRCHEHSGCQSIMPLAHMVRALRVPALFMHDVLDPLLGSARAIQEYFHTTLPKLLNTDSHSELDSIIQASWTAARIDTTLEQFIERAERRQIQIQVLLYMINISLPPAPPPVHTSSVEPQRKRKRGRKEKGQMQELPPLDARVEFFMDKLSIWQLTDNLAMASDTDDVDQDPVKDWAQLFCEEVVEPLFKTLLPEQCALLRSKLFRELPARSSSRSPSPTTRGPSRARSRSTTPNPGPFPTAAGARAVSPLRASDLKRERSMSRQPSVGPSTARATSPLRKAEFTRELSTSRQPSVGLSSQSNESATASNSIRSRSRSVSVAADEVASKGAHRGGVAGSSALFRAMPARQPSMGAVVSENTGSKFKRTASVTNSVFSSKPSSSSTSISKSQQVSTVANGKRLLPEHTTLVPDTPVKRIKLETRNTMEWSIPESPVKGTQSQNQPGLVDDSSLSRASVLSELSDPSDEEMNIGLQHDDGDSSDGDTVGAHILAANTPTRPRRR